MLTIFISSIYVNSLDHYSYFPEIKSSDKILIFSPHPDDESLGTAGVIEKALEHNATVLVVEMTNGDLMSPDEFKSYLNSINESDYPGSVGDLRQNETLNAVKALGLNQNDVIFLGYPDGGLKQLLEENWADDNLFHMNTGSNRYNHSPYNLCYEKNAPYSGSNVEKNVKQIIMDYKPDIVFYPDDNDYHSDHYATNAFVRYALLDTNYSEASYTYLIHHNNWPRSIGIPYTNYIMPSEISSTEAHWLVNKLNKNQQNTKISAIFLYKTQMADMNLLLESFTRKNEFYSVYPPQIIRKVNGTDSFQNNMPTSNFKKTINNTQKTILPKSNYTITTGIAYDDQNLYLLLKSYDLNKFEYNFHLKLFNERNVTPIDLKVKNNKILYGSISNNSINPPIQTNNDIMIITLPYNLFNQTKSILLYIDFYDNLTGQKVDQTTWKIFQF
ncbi:MAG: PIG-L family deacetylase [Methanobacterium sp.]|nr:PIG-L family deacetylase [Methanobacterium sp.]